MTTISQPSTALRFASLGRLGFVVFLASLLMSCYYDPYAFQAGSSYNTYGRQLPANAYQAPIRGQRQAAYSTQPRVNNAPARQPAYPSAQPPTYQPAVTPYPYSTAPVAAPYQTAPVAAPYQTDNRWNTGNDWITRQQGTKVNTRGSGRAWRNRSLGQRRSPSPNPTPNWQSAAVYPSAAPTTYPAAGAGYPTTAPNYGVAAAGTYVVRRGDNLSTIARNHGCTVGELMQINGLPSSVIQPGLVLNLPR